MAQIRLIQIKQSKPPNYVITCRCCPAVVIADSSTFLILTPNLLPSKRPINTNRKSLRPSAVASFLSILELRQHGS